MSIRAVNTYDRGNDDLAKRHDDKSRRFAGVGAAYKYYTQHACIVFENRICFFLHRSRFVPVVSWSYYFVRYQNNA